MLAPCRHRRRDCVGRLDRRREATLTKELLTEREAVLHIARSHGGGLRFHDLRRSYATGRRRWRSAKHARPCDEPRGDHYSAAALHPPHRRDDDRPRIVDYRLALGLGDGVQADHLYWWAILGLNQWPLPCQRRFALAIAAAGYRIGFLASENVLGGLFFSRPELQRLLTSC
jgi:hypothetical protein